MTSRTDQTPQPTADAPGAVAGVEPRISDAERAIGHRFADRTLLRQALVHASLSDTRLASNERMEFLGDAVLGLVACELIFERYPGMLEGDMTKIKSTVVSRRTCARIAKDLGLDELLEIGKGMRLSGQNPLSLAAAALEAVVCAVYLDAGYDACRAFLSPLLKPFVEDAADSGHHQNFKSVLQQHAQQALEATPAYRVLDEQGPDHAKCFRVEVRVGAHKFAGQWAPSKKQAEQRAALEALTALGVVQLQDDGGVRVVEPSGA